MYDRGERSKRRYRLSPPARIRELRESDWPALLDLANRSVAHVEGAGSQEVWLENRRNFDTEKRIQHHFVAEQDGSL